MNATSGPMIVAGFALVVAGGLALLTLSQGDETAGLATAGDVDGLKRRVDELESRLVDADGRIERLRRDNRDLVESLADAARRVQELENAPPMVTVAGGQGSEGLEPAAPSEAEAREEFESLRKKVWDGTATSAEQERFWELARSTGLLDGVLADLEQGVQANPADIDARMTLASGYVAKLLTVPDGPLRGLWAQKAMGQWQKVLEVDENHWEARYSVAFSWSQYPDFLNKTPDAIREFERLREIQERGAPEPRHAGVYVQLANLYRKQGNADKSRETLRRGLDLHPGNPELQKSLDSMGQ